LTGFIAVLGISLLFLVAGCQQGPSSTSDTKGSTRSDKDLIQAQGSCPVSKKKLGSMGEPVKVTVKGQPVFLCCASCKDEALANPEKTLTAVEELKRKNKE
jgi:hypothetical protein